MSASELIFPKEDSPDPLPAVIKIDGDCYELDGETGDDETNAWDDVDADYTNCDDCQGKECSFTFSIA